MKNYPGTDKENSHYWLSVSKKPAKEEERFKFGSHPQMMELDEPLQKHVQPMREILLQKKLLKEKFISQLKLLFPSMNKVSQIHVTFSMYSHPQPQPQLFNPIPNHIPLNTLSSLNKDSFQKSLWSSCDTFSVFEGECDDKKNGLLYFPVVTKKPPFSEYLGRTCGTERDSQHRLLREVFLKKLGSKKDSTKHHKSSLLLKNYWLKKESNKPFVFKHVSLGQEEVVEEVKFHSKG